MVRQRVRIRFCKQGDLRWIGHRDLVRCLERIFRRAALPLGMSQGFHPKPRMTFPSALAVGIEGADEVMELELAEARTGEEVLSRLAAHTVPGLAVKSVDVLPQGSRKARLQSVRYRVPVPPEFREGLAEKIDRLMAAPSHPIRRPNRPEPIDLRPPLEELTLQEGRLEMRLRIGPRESVRPREVLSALGLQELEFHGVHLTRSSVEICS